VFEEADLVRHALQIGFRREHGGDARPMASRLARWTMP
jgi:hypothetical protein